MKDEPVYLVVPRKMIVTWVVTNLLIFVLIFASFQYTNYTDRRSNKAWCDIIAVSDDGYRMEPPTTPTGQLLARGFRAVRTSPFFGCE